VDEAELRIESSFTIEVVCGTPTALKPVKQVDANAFHFNLQTSLISSSALSEIPFFSFLLLSQFSEFVVSDGEDRKVRSLPKLSVALVDRSRSACSEKSLSHIKWGPAESEGSQVGSFTSRIDVKCCITRSEEDGITSSSSASGAIEILKLEGCDAAGWVSSSDQEWTDAGNKFHFKNLTVEKNPNVPDGRF
jgi:hypothetical protein